MSQEDLVEFEDYVAAIKRRRKLIAVVVAGFVLAGAAVSVITTDVYTSESRVSVTPVFDPGAGTTEEVNIDTERGIAKSTAVASIAARVLRSSTSPSDLLDRVSVSPVGESTILSIKYTHTDPQQAYRGADAFARAYLTFRAREADAATRQTRVQLQEERSANADQKARLERQLEGLAPGTAEYREISDQIRAIDGAQSAIDRQLQELSSDTVDPGTIIDEAEVPTSPSNPGLLLNVAGAALIGLVIALSATFVLERRNLGRRGAGAEKPAPEPPATEPPATAEAPTPEPAPEPEPEPEPAVTAAPAAPEPPVVAPTRTRAALPSAIEATAPAPAAPVVPERPADRRRRRDPSKVLAGLGVELLGTVPRLSNDAGEPAFDAVALGGRAGEALRRLHATLRPRLEQTNTKIVFVTSAVERGVTVGLAGGLAATAALAGQDALLIAGDLHQPRLHDRLELGNDQGLAEVLSGKRPLVQVLQGWSGIETLCVVTAGRPGPDPSSLISPDRLGAQLATVREEFGLIVIEGPPLGATTDATIMASVCDAVILAVDPRHSAENELGGAVERLRVAGAPLLGAVVVEARAAKPGLPATTAAAPSRG